MTSRFVKRANIQYLIYYNNQAQRYYKMLFNAFEIIFLA